MRPIKLRPGRLPDGVSPGEPAALIASGLGVGYVPFASGTWGSLAALPVAWLLHAQFGALALVAAAIVATLAGIWAADRLVRIGDDQDPGYIVIDEIAAQFLALAFAPLTWWGYALAFLLFRAADIFKPFPANWCDAHVKGGLGVMLDDLVAGLYAGIATWAICRFMPIEALVRGLGL